MVRSGKEASRRQPLLVAVLVPVALLAVAAGCSEPAPTPDLPWHGRDLAEPGWDTQTLDPQGIYEIVYTLDEGAALAWDWVIPNRATTHFIVHTHTTAGTDVVYNETVGSSSRGRFVAPKDGQYGLQWSNTNAVAELHLKVPPGGVARYLDPNPH